MGIRLASIDFAQVYGDVVVRIALCLISGDELLSCILLQARIVLVRFQSTCRGEVDLLRSKLVMDVVLCEVSLVLQHQSDHEDEQSDDEATY